MDKSGIGSLLGKYGHWPWLWCQHACSRPNESQQGIADGLHRKYEGHNNTHTWVNGQLSSNMADVCAQYK